MRRDGRASWRGEAFVERLGEFKGTLEPRDFEQLANFIERCSFLEWNDDYRPVHEITDGPTYELEVTDGRRTKTVRQYLSDEPADFWVIATLVDGLATTVAWVPTGV